MRGAQGVAGALPENPKLKNTWVTGQNSDERDTVAAKLWVVALKQLCKEKRFERLVVIVNSWLQLLAAPVRMFKGQLLFPIVPWRINK